MGTQGNYLRHLHVRGTPGAIESLAISSQGHDLWSGVHTCTAYKSRSDRSVQPTREKRGKSALTVLSATSAFPFHLSLAVPGGFYGCASGMGKKPQETCAT